MRIGIIGAGMAGLSCVTHLAEAGHKVVLVDKGRGPGGRMSTRRLATGLGEIGFDHGAQYLTARDPAFIAQVERWAADGHVARWSAAGDDAWLGTSAMNAPIRALASGLDIGWGGHVEALARVSDGGSLRGDGIDPGSFDTAIVAVPAEQVPPLVSDDHPEWAAFARETRSEPCWTAMAAYSARLPVAFDRLGDGSILASAVRNSAKPRRAGPEAWLLQASGPWSVDHIEDAPETVEACLLEAFQGLIGEALPSPVATAVHRWRYARSGILGRDALWHGSVQLGLCGDWLVGDRIEAAWLSGRKLAHMVLAA